MAKAPSSVIGIDLGRSSVRSVVLQRRSNGRFAITSYASRVFSEAAQDAEQLGRELKSLFKELGSSTKVCAVGVSSPEAIIRIIEQPETPTHMLRDALRLNGMALLNQDCRSFVLDCDLIPSSEASPDEGAARKKYLVGGLPREEVTQIAAAFDKTSAGVGSLQLAPICTFNAFEFAHSEVFNDHAFLLVDIGFFNSTMMLGARRELVLVRTIDFGGRLLVETLMALSGESEEGVLTALEQEDELMVENMRMAISVLTREIGSSIGFFEGRREETIDRVFVSGAAAKAKTLLKVMAEELHMPCEPWSALSNCEVALAPKKREQYDEEAFDLNVACGAATELLTR